ncbi:uncharacterized protein LOC128883142 [Hylaeus volcanicus]|uniref:uncharacterized protein LOC128883142 n=1 Tax=Hylaeus volcanicus TaxID=313075 RepID=UPI0023B8409C|nr:uncharacterized protein LOC128883142 [Hylaeus volcanicus]
MTPCKPLTKPRYLQEISEESSLPPLTDNTFNQLDTRRKKKPLHCFKKEDCLSGFGTCQNSICTGFFPDLNDERTIKCVSGYICKSHPGDLPGAGVNNDFQIIGIHPDDSCGSAEPLAATESLFANSNRWQCEKSNENDCIFTAGVGYPRNLSSPIETIRLCGCPGIDTNNNGRVCDSKSEFYVPLGYISIQECLRNAHCVDLGLASCDVDHCVRGVAVAATAGLKVLQCLTSQNCRMKSLGAQAVAESMKLLPIASSHSCGAKRALDPDAISDAALPCVVQLSPEGRCEVNLGFKSFGSSRLCGCLGDPGGNGRDCDQVEDFTDEMGLIDNGECSTDEDCSQKYSICINQQCQVDNLEPKVIDSIPRNGSYAVPPINQISLLWHETIQFIDTDRKVVILNTDPNLKLKWEVKLQDPSTYSIAETGYKVEIVQGTQLRIIPDISIASFPEGNYLIIYEGGIVADMAGNTNTGAMDIQFTVSKNAGCPYLAVTGFSPIQHNPNGVYFSIEPINNHAAWIRVGKPETVYIFWHPEMQHDVKKGSWVISPQKESRQVIAFENTTNQESLHESLRPEGHHWNKFQINQVIDLHDIHILCTSVQDTEFPKLLKISPPNGAKSVPTEKCKIELTFSKPVTYGHWSNITIASDKDSITLYPDVESGFRGQSIKAFMNETVLIDLSDVYILSPGTVYQVTVYVGFVTDLWYNYWDEEGVILTFTTYGVSCQPFEDLGEAYIVEGNHTNKNGDSYRVSCRQGYSLIYEEATFRVDATPKNGVDHLDTETESTFLSDPQDQNYQDIRCLDGTWEPLKHICKKDCTTYHVLSPQYKVLVDDSFHPPAFTHGMVLPVKCSDKAIALSGETTGTLRCNDGLWEIDKLMCTLTCTPYSSLNSFYKVSLDSNDPLSLSAGLLVGARRIISCSPPATSGKGPETVTVVCGEQGWSQLQLECHVECKLSTLRMHPSLTLRKENFLQENVTGAQEPDTVEHGKSLTVDCSSGYSQGFPSFSSLHDIKSTTIQTKNSTVRCQDGEWVWIETPSCFKNCDPLVLQDNYQVDSVAGDFTTHGSSVYIKCKQMFHDQTLEFNYNKRGQPPIEDNSQQILTCNDGTWSTLSLVCRSPCKRPEVQFGLTSYTSIIHHDETEHLNELSTKPLYVPQLFYHGTMASLYCSSTSEIIKGTPGETIQCNNGKWVSVELTTHFTKTEEDVTEHQSPLLKCQTRCGPHLKDTERFIYAGGDYVLRKLVQNPLSEGSSLTLLCQKGFSPALPSTHSKGKVICQDGQLVEEGHLTCMKICGQPSFSVLFIRGYNLTDPTIVAVDHLQNVSLKCRDSFELQIHTKQDDSGMVAQCFNGKFLLPKSKCGPSSCFDGERNGDEVDVDCGGTHCPENRQACPTLSRISLTEEALATFQCHDRQKNNHEESIDCGGDHCTPCEHCHGLPFLLQTGMSWTTDKGKTLHHFIKDSSDPQHAFSFFIEGTLLNVMCSPGYDQISLPPVLGFQTFRCAKPSKTQSAEWILEGSHKFVLQCVSPTCFDSIMNGDEENVDCGGSCEQPCGTCDDHKKNGDEEDIDCGGSRCLPCEGCSMAPLKTLDKKNLYITVRDSKGHIVDFNHSLHEAATQHGNEWIVTCRQQKNQSISLRCRNGRWIDSHVFFTRETTALPSYQETLQKLSCYPYKTSGVNSLRETENSRIAFLKKIFSIPVIPKDPHCSQRHNDLSDVDRDNKYCCTLISKFNKFMSSECGALVFSSGDSKMNAFCTGYCKKDIQALFRDFKENGRPKCAKLSLFEEMIEIYCSTKKESTSSDHSDSKKPIFCFTFAKTALSKIKRFQDLSKSFLEEACSPKSCVRSLFRYMEILSLLLPTLHDSHSFQTGISRTLEEIQNNPTPIILTGLNEYNEMMRQLLTNFINIWFQVGNETITATVPSTKPHARWLQAHKINPFISSLKTFSLLSAKAVSGKLLDFLCLKDAKGQSCGSTVMSFLSDDQKQLSAFAQILSLKSDKACTSSKCFWEVTRYLGQTMYSEGLHTLNPLLTTFGLLVRMYGRVACQTSESHKSCALSLGLNMTDLAFYLPPHFENHFFTTRHLQSFPTGSETTCQCPKIFLGDGLCDTECFNFACSFDKGDCQLGKMFPHVHQLLNAILPLTDTCHPFSSYFTCSRDSSGCYHRIIEIMKAEGCCASVRWNSLREILLAQSHLEYLVELKEKKQSSVKTLVSLNLHKKRLARDSSTGLDDETTKDFILHRSTLWLETVCQLSLNAACAGGLFRSQIHLNFILNSIHYDPLFTYSSYEEYTDLLREMLREVVSNVLALPLSDIIEMQFWPWNIDVQIVIDPGVLAGEVRENLKKEIMNGNLNSSLNEGVKLFLNYIKERHFKLYKKIIFFHSKNKPPKTRSLFESSISNIQNVSFISDLSIDEKRVKDLPLSLSQIRKPPKQGTFDMNTLKNQLFMEACHSLPHLSLPEEFSKNSFEDYSQFYNITLFKNYKNSIVTQEQVLPHESQLHVACQRGYTQSFHSSGASPQTLVCERGRWILKQPHETLIECRQPCEPYEVSDKGFDPLIFSISSVGDHQDGAQRIIQCQNGYVAIHKMESSETLVCRHGVWDRRSLDCIPINQIQKTSKTENVVCGDIFLKNILELTSSSQNYFVKELLPKQIVNALSIQNSDISQPTTIQLWKLSCTRGYTPSENSVPSLTIACMNKTFLSVMDLPVTLRQPTHSVNQSYNSFDTFKNLLEQKKYRDYVFRLYYEYSLQFHSMQETPPWITLITSSQPLSYFQCLPDIKNLAYNSNQNPHLSEFWFYLILLLATFAFIVLIVSLIYLKRTNCFRRPFFEQPDPTLHTIQTKRSHELKTKTNHNQQTQDTGYSRTQRTCNFTVERAMDFQTKDIPSSSPTSQQFSETQLTLLQSTYPKHLKTSSSKLSYKANNLYTTLPTTTSISKPSQETFNLVQPLYSKKVPTLEQTSNRSTLRNKRARYHLNTNTTSPPTSFYEDPLSTTFHESNDFIQGFTTASESQRTANESPYLETTLTKKMSGFFSLSNS